MSPNSSGCNFLFLPLFPARYCTHHFALFLPAIAGKWSSSGSNRRGNRPPQRFAIEPQSKVATIGEDVVLACRVENKVGTLQWTRDGFGLGIDRNLSGFSRYAMVGNDEEGDYTLHIRGVTLEDDADFQCQVGAMDGIKGIRSRFAHLNVRGRWIQGMDEVTYLCYCNVFWGNFRGKLLK